jgi:hypothetical protein
LPEAVQALAQKAHIVRMLAVDEPGGLLGVHRFFELAVEEGVADVELMHERPVGRSEG